MARHQINTLRNRLARRIAEVRRRAGTSFVKKRETLRAHARAGFSFRPAACHAVPGMLWLGIALGVFARVLRESWTRQAFFASREYSTPAALFSALETTYRAMPDVFIAGGICLLLAFLSFGAGFMVRYRRRTSLARARELRRNNALVRESHLV